MTLYEKAKKLLHDEYVRNFEIVKNSHYHKSFANEKIRHSLQVAGVGNGILRNEEYFKDKSYEFIEISKTAILLHDIFRFSEITIKYQTGEKVDHGVLGADFLRKIPEFNNPLIVLPVKHHGHMIEVLYEDEEYNSIKDEKIKEQVRHIIFAVRDADKIANWRILTNEYEQMRLVWLPNPDNYSEEQGIITDKVWESFCKKEVVAHSLLKTNADALISVLAWLFDINYKYSLEYSLKLNLFEGFNNILQDMKVNEDKKNITNEFIKKYISENFKL